MNKQQEEALELLVVSGNDLENMLILHAVKDCDRLRNSRANWIMAVASARRAFGVHDKTWEDYNAEG